MSLSRELGASREKRVTTDGLVLPGTTIGGEVGTFSVEFYAVEWGRNPLS